jgi:hypothetical protein
MKNQYVADINDYRKYGLLRALSGGGKIRTGVCWMLTPNDDRTDGQFTRYLHSPEQWKQYDPSLFGCLVECIRDGERDVSRIESAGILLNAIFHCDLLSDSTQDRARYFADMHERLQNTDLIFFDPDNGIEIKSHPYGRKHSSKFLYWHELTQAYSAGKSVLVYQHFIREKRDNFVTRLSSEFCRRLAAPEILSFRTPHVVFFLVSQPEHALHFEQQAAVIAKKWREQVQVDVHRQAQQKGGAVTSRTLSEPCAPSMARTNFPLVTKLLLRNEE